MKYSLHLRDGSFEVSKGSISTSDSPTQLRILSVLDRPMEEIHHVSLDIQEETLRFLCGSRAISGPLELIQILLDIGVLFDIQRFILYRIINVTEAEILLIFSLNEAESESVGQILPIHNNINLKKAVRSRVLSQIPVEWIGIDAAFPIGMSHWANRLVVWVDTVHDARSFSPTDMASLTPTALLLATAYNAGHATHAKGLDALTGLKNRSALDKAIDSCVDVFDMPIPTIKTVAFFDIDFFKQFNSDYGHHTGDAVLIHVAKQIQEVTESLGGSAFRYWGEEFVATFPNAMTHEEIDAIRAHVEKSVCVHEWIQHNVHISVGYSTEEGLSANTVKHHSSNHQVTLIRSANKALLVAKSTGRNRTVRIDS